MTKGDLEQRFERFRRAGDPSALAEVFDRTAPTLLRIARRLGPRDEAEDLVQATFLLAIERRDSFDASRALEPWLVGILLLQASAARRRRTRDPEVARLAERANPDPHELAAAREITELVSEALAKLQPKDREVLVPLLLDGRRAAEIARELARRPEAIHMRVHRGLARLRKLLPASFALVLASVTSLTSAGALARVRASILRHAQRELGLAASAAVPPTFLGALMPIQKLAFVAAALAVVLALLVPPVISQDDPTPRERAALPAPTARDGEREHGSPVLGSSALEASSRAERTSLEVREPKIAELVVEVAYDDGRPAASAEVALARGEHDLARSTLDAHGRARFDANDGEGELIIRPRGEFPSFARVPLAAGLVRIALRGGGSLAGKLVERDGSPAAGVHLALSTDIELPGRAASAEVRGLEEAQLVARATSDEKGAFRFEGLPEGWSGELQLLGRVVLADGATSGASKLWLSESSLDLVVTCARPPRIHGRIVEAGALQPLPECHLETRVGHRDGQVGRGSTLTDAHGRFEVEVYHEAGACSFQIAAANARGRVSQPSATFRWSDDREDLDLGDIEITLAPTRAVESRAQATTGPLSGDESPADASRAFEVRTIRGRVVDENGRGIVDALVDGDNRTEPDGRFSITRDARERSTITFQKSGFVPTSADAPDASDAELEVILQRGRRLEVRVVDASGRIYDDVIVQAELERGQCVQAARDSGGKHTLLGLPSARVVVATQLCSRTYSVSAGPDESAVTITVPEHGRLEISWARLADAPSKSSMPAENELHVRLRKRGSVDTEARVVARDDGAVFPHVPPGDHEVVRERHDESTGRWIEIGRPTPVHVEPGSTQRVELR